MKRFLTILVIGLAVATTAYAQYGGGMGGGHGGGGHRGSGGRRSQTPDPQGADRSPSATQSRSRAGRNQIIGVIKAIDPAAGRVTITYEEADALNWPAGTTTFVVSKSSLLNGARIGEKVAFRIESQQISEMAPYATPQEQASDAGWSN